jgi:transcriptional regulator NrdR family protein
MARGGRRPTDKIACPSCGCLQSSVEYIRQTLDKQQTGGFWRRRECGGCGKKFETEEIVRGLVDPLSSTRTPPKTQAF